MLRQAQRFVSFALPGLLLFAAPSGAAGATGHPAQAPVFRPFAALHRSGIRRPDANDSLLYSFGQVSGTYDPVAKLVADGSGALYGTTLNGGSQVGECAELSGFNGYGCGGVFKLTPNGSGGFSESLIYTFQGGADGAAPYAELYVDSSGALYGTTAEGGSGTCLYGGTDYGCGTVFKLTPDSSGTYTESVIYAFQGGTDGAYPSAGLVADSLGALYGTTQNGGDSSSNGTVFKLSPKKKGYAEKVLHRFGGCSTSSAPCDGAIPWATLYLSPSGALFGTTLYGGSHQCADGNLCGTVFRMMPGSDGKRYGEKVIYNFQGGTDGEGPQGAVTGDASGAIYGTTSYGGGANWKQCNDGSIIRGCGVVFKLKPRGKRYTESVLYAFQGGLDAAVPQAGVIFDSNGNLDGTTYFGGETASNGSGGCGTLFQLAVSSSSYTESVLYRFQGCRASSIDSAFPSSGLIEENGVLYGTTTKGGRFGAGSVFSFPD
jgi:uncharacterized repeat protein (TIGR03803 family)